MRKCDPPELTMINKAKKYLKQYFGYNSFRKGQDLIIKSILDKKDTLGIMPTGGGKSICYQIPALCFEGLTIVVSPLISLMKDQIDQLHSVRYPAEMLNSTVPYFRQIQIKQLIESNSIKLLYLTPERLRNDNFINLLRNIDVSCFVIDEAHCISEWGHDFRPEYRQLKEIINILNHPPILALTATATHEVRDDIIISLNMKNANKYVTGFNRENLIYGVQVHFSKEEKNIALKDFIKRSPLPGIVYTSSIKDAETVYNILDTNTDKKIGIYHGGLNNNNRKKMQEDFQKGQLDILVATNAFGMGIDKKDIRFIVHYSFPGSIESYYQETGRAGRNGKTSYCLLFALDEDERLQKFFITSNSPSFDKVNHFFNIVKQAASKKVIYSDDLKYYFKDKDMNDFAISSILKQLRSMDCIKIDYVPNETVEISIKKSNIDEENKYLLEDLLSESIHSKRFFSKQKSFLKKRSNLTDKELIKKLDELSEKKIISYQIISKGQVLKLNCSELTNKFKKEYISKRKKKLEIDLKKLSTLTNYSKLSTCRRKYLLNYFGEDLKKDNCGTCDICRGTFKEKSGLKWSPIQKEILLFFINHDGKIGRKKAVSILKGSYDIENKYTNWDEYGNLRTYDTKSIESELGILFRNNILETDNGKYPVIKISKDGLRKIKDLFKKFTK